MVTTPSDDLWDAYLTATERPGPDVHADRRRALAAHHLRVGAHRDAARDLIEVVPARQVAEQLIPAGAHVVSVVTDDLRHVVDSVLLALTSLGWAIHDLVHPQFEARREAGDLVAFGAGGVAESWVQVVATAPLGAAADVAGLVTQIEHALTAVRAAHDDRDALRALAERTAAEVASGDFGGTDDERALTADLLTWLADGHFLFVGARDAEVAGETFTPLPESALGQLRTETGGFDAVAREGDHDLLVITKDSTRSVIQRGGPRDYVAVRRLDATGRVVGERRFVGLLAASAYTEDASRIPMLAHRSEQILAASGYAADSHGGRAIREAIATHPRDELFQAPVPELISTITQVAELRERRQVRLFLRRGRWGRFVQAVVYLPRDRYNTDVRTRMQQVLTDAFDATAVDFRVQVSESVLARLFFTVTLAPGSPADRVDEQELETALASAAQGWDDTFASLADDWPSADRGVDFPASYKEHNTPHQGTYDLALMNTLEPGRMRLVLYRPDLPEAADLRVKVMLLEQHMTLSGAMPHWNALGLTVLDERSYQISLRGRSVTMVDFGMAKPDGLDFDQAARTRLLEAFEASYQGRCDLDELNQLVTSAGLNWRQVRVLRAIARYLHQLQVPYSQAYVARVLCDHPALARALVQLFQAKFDPSRADRVQVGTLTDALLAKLDEIDSLDADRILRYFLAVVQACVRTNAYLPGARALALKLHLRQLSFAPQPVPEIEVFVHSPQVEGVHLRFGAVARGGLRWSDRPEDFRTEVLGLVKAQTVKNTVIVPTGAKGGFVPRQLPPISDRQAWLEAGREAYQVFIGSLLDVTDNLVAGEAVTPDDVVRHDGDDPYLVVAADKGTASFSDTANAIALQRGFWLGDAFASGGSKGYDHKAMGITARGAWESAKLHLAELGIDEQTDDFTCVGIGDMSGDVFGNGLLRTEHVKLVAAFNHLHIFLDPDPDPVVSFGERKRLFELPRSTWADYDPALISAGGGVHERSAKSVEITPQVRASLALPDDVTHLTPAELISAILRAPVDLLYNGGIGTYVKASTETHAQVGDKANDAVRVDGRQVRAKIAVEGGNLGWTQAGRIEFARAGGVVNTDFIDNSAGVDTSDHEVNIKILLAAAVADGTITEAERDALLPTMTDDIAALVLRHNVSQNIALSNARSRAASMNWVHESLIAALEQSVGLDRRLEGLPDTKAMAAMIEAGEGLCNPELATLLAWTKIDLAQRVLASDLPDDPFVQQRLVSYFPPALRERFAEQIRQHPLRRELITTVAINRFVDSQGISADHRLRQETGLTSPDIIRAQLAARSIFHAGDHEIATSRSGVDPAVQSELRLAMRKLVERGTRWFAQHGVHPLDVQAEIDRFEPGVAEIRAVLPNLLTERSRALHDQLLERYAAAGVGDALARDVAGARFGHLALSMVQVAQQTGRPLVQTAAVFVGLVERLHLDDLLALIEALPRQNVWDLQARSAMRDDLLELQTHVTAQVLGQASGDAGDDSALVEQWVARVPQFEQRLAQLDEVTSSAPDVARISVALRLIRGLAEAAARQQASTGDGTSTDRA